MEKAGQKGHALRYRHETQEWVHDFMKGAAFEHAYCVATPLRKANGRS